MTTRIIPDSSSLSNGFTVDTRVLYVCARGILSPGHPTATGNLSCWVFDWSIDEKLKAIYRYARAHWETVGDEWVSLFAGDDAHVTNSLTKVAEDSPLKELPQQTNRVVILVVDDADKLLEEDHYTGHSKLQELREALNRVNHEMYYRKSCRAFMGVFVSSNPHTQLDINRHIYSRIIVPYGPPLLVAVAPFRSPLTSDRALRSNWKLVIALPNGFARRSFASSMTSTST